MIWSCDLTSAFEDGGIGGMVVAVLVGLWTWWNNHQKNQAAKGGPNAQAR